jgi:DsbC/DsbD-like thiol-disulfide interchange protein
VDEVVQVSLIEGWRMENGRHMAGIRIALAPGWKTYWRAPGEGGVPTVLRLRSAEGIDGHGDPLAASGGVLHQWHAIHRVSRRCRAAGGIRGASDGPVDLEGRLDLGVCLDICMPVTLDLTGELLPDADRDRAIGIALSDRP